MKILQPTAYYEPETFSSAHLNSDLEEAIIKAGHTMYIVTPQPTRGCSVEQYSNYLPYEEKRNGKITIERFALMREGKNTLQRAFRYLYMNIIEYLKCSNINDIDILYTASTPPTQGALAALLKKKLKVPFIYNLQDIFPDSMVSAGIINKGGLIWKIGNLVAQFTYNNADKIIVISNEMKYNLIDKGVEENKIEVIYNWIDTDAVKPIPVDKNMLIKELGVDCNTFRVVYAGNLGSLQGVSTIIQAASILTNKNIDFYIFGDGAEKEKLREEARFIKNIYFYPLQSISRVSEVYSLGDCCVVSCNKGVGKSAFPSKIWTILACGRPLLLSFDKIDFCNTLIDNNMGLYSQAEDASSLAKNIEFYKNNINKCYSDGVRAREYVLKNINKKSSLEKYLSILNRITKEQY